MLTKVLIGVCLSACVAACASAPPATRTAAQKTPPAGCVAGTASRLPPTPGDCAAFGRTWTYDDIKHTGATDAAQALSLLDPSLTVSH